MLDDFAIAKKYRTITVYIVEEDRENEKELEKIFDNHLDVLLVLPNKKLLKKQINDIMYDGPRKDVELDVGIMDVEMDELVEVNQLTDEVIQP